MGNHIKTIVPSSVQDASLHTWIEPHPLSAFGQFFHYSISFLSFPSGAAATLPPPAPHSSLLTSIFSFNVHLPLTLSHSLTPCPFPLSFLVLSSHFSLIFSPPGSGPNHDFCIMWESTSRNLAPNCPSHSPARIMADVVKGRSGIHFFVPAAAVAFSPFPLIPLVEFF